MVALLVGYLLARLACYGAWIDMLAMLVVWLCFCLAMLGKLFR
jgi:hypothetical protein